MALNTEVKRGMWVVVVDGAMGQVHQAVRGAEGFVLRTGPDGPYRAYFKKSVVEQVNPYQYAQPIEPKALRGEQDANENLGIHLADD